MNAYKLKKRALMNGIKRDRIDWWSREYSENKLEYIAIMLAVVVLLAAVGMARAA